MLAHLPSSTDYNNFIHSLPSEYSNLLSCKLIDPQYASAIFKMTHLDVDSISDLLPLSYSHTGRLAVKQMEILRSFVLMLHFKCVSIKQWCKSLTDKPVRAILIGCLPGDAPSASNHYNFISRLLGGFKYHSIYPPKRYGKPKDSKPKKNNKWEKNPPHITEQAFDFYLNSDYDNNRVEFLLQQIFDKIAVEFSVSHNLIDTSKLISASGDGSAFHIHSSSRGHRVITCPEDKDDLECLRRYSAPEANWGWDNDTEQYFFGYNIYTCCYYNKSINSIFLFSLQWIKHQVMTL